MQLATFLRLLHCALQAFPAAQRHPPAAYRAINLTEVQRVTPEPHPMDVMRTYVRFDGFTSCVQRRLPRSWEWNRDVLLVMTPTEPANPNCGLHHEHVRLARRRGDVSLGPTI